MIEKSALPEIALLQAYVRSGAYTDCYSTETAVEVSITDYVTSFYTTWLFRLERFILRWLVSRPSSDEQARQLSAGELEAFAAWYVEARCENQLLMCDFRDRTRSWFMVTPTRLYFGSAVVPDSSSSSSKPSRGVSHKLLLGLHKLYSRALLAAAKSRLQC